MESNAKIKVLLLGGTGAIGSSLVEILKRNHINTYVTTRKDRKNQHYITYIKGNAHDDYFLSNICSCCWDVIVDFMAYGTNEFKNRKDLLLNATKQYIFISSARVYGNEEHPIKETSPRLLDCTNDYKYLSTDEYAITKARQENILFESDKNNYTIVRPYITYGKDRFQFGPLEKEEWLYRAMHGRTVVFSKEISEHLTSITDSYDVAYGIFNLMGDNNTLGKVFHITSNNTLKWSEIFDIYKDTIKKITGKEIKIKLVTLPVFLKTRQEMLRYQVVYDRLFDRDFDISNQSKYMNTDKFSLPYNGLNKYIESFMGCSKN